MTDSKTIQPDPALIARLHHACMPWLKQPSQSAFDFAQGDAGSMDHVLESPDNARSAKKRPAASDYEPDKA